MKKTLKFRSEAGFTPLEVLGRKISLKFFCRHQSAAGIVPRPHRQSYSSFHKDKFLAGFTVPEMLVALTLFLIVVGATTGVFLSSYRSQRSAFAFLNVQNNIRYALEVMAREMRTGSGFQPDTNSIAFTNQYGESIVYRLSNGRIERSSNGLAGPFAPITAAEVTVSDFKIATFGLAAGDGQQPRITISLKISSQVGTQQAESVVQTTVSQRELDS